MNRTLWINYSIALDTQSCPMRWGPMDGSLPSSSVRGILQARTLEWVAFPFSGGSSQPRDHTWVSWIAGKFFIIWATRETQKPNRKLRERQQCKKWTPWMKTEEHLGSEMSRKPRDTGWEPREATQSRVELGFRRDSGVRGFVELSTAEFWLCRGWSRTFISWTSLVVQWLRPHVPNVWGPGSIPG